MNVYSVIKEFAAPQLGVRLLISDSVGKIGNRTSVVVNSTQYPDKAFWDWVGTADSLNYLLFVGTVPDPSVPGVTTILTGTVPIVSGDDFVVVSAAFGFVPSAVVCMVTKPDGGDNLFVTPRESTISATGFTVDLSAPASGSGYALVYVVVE